MSITVSLKTNYKAHTIKGALSTIVKGKYKSLNTAVLVNGYNIHAST